VTKLGYVPLINNNDIYDSNLIFPILHQQCQQKYCIMSKNLSWYGITKDL